MLITAGAGGLRASPIPFLLYRDEGRLGVLRAHVARANPHWQVLAEADECLVVFQGPDAYVTPSWYPAKVVTHKVVPTWNYATVQARGRPAVIDNGAWLRRQLDDLTREHEGKRREPWAVADAPADFIAGQMQAIIGIEIPVERLDGKFKMSQSREEGDRAGVMAGMGDPDDAHCHPAVAAMIRRSSR